MRAKKHLEDALRGVLAALGLPWPAKTTIEPPKNKQFGDMATNAAMLLAKETQTKPIELAQKIRSTLLAAHPELADIQVAGPGFLNITFTAEFWQRTVNDILSADQNYGRATSEQPLKVMVEYVSANPTGPLHIGHGRGAALGDSLARILRYAGYKVLTEYYINDAGKQMDILASSVLFRMRRLAGGKEEMPEECYKGLYITDLAARILEQKGPSFCASPEAAAFCREFAVSSILQGIKDDLASFRVEHDHWFSEQSMVNSGQVDQTLNQLLEKGLAYEQDGAIWFRTASFGDDKDRVLRKSDGSLTYFASDITYHADKFKRGIDLAVDIWGADHHGYVDRMKAAVEAALGKGRGSLEILLVHLVTLMRNGQQLPMSTRAGEFVTLREVIDEVGTDAARFMFLSRKSNSPLDFDLDLMKQKNMENPVYYVQYAHARIHSLLRKAEERSLPPDPPEADILTALDTEEDLELLKHLEEFPDVVLLSASSLSPHYISYYLMQLAASLHKYYTLRQVLAASEEKLIQARLLLCRAVAVVLRNGLALLGVSAPEKM